MLDGYQIAIPSYRRSRICADATIATLIRYGIDLKRVTVWVANEDEAVDYVAALPTEVTVKVAVLGKVNAQRYYHSQYPKGTPLVNLDDDLYDIHQKIGEKLEPLSVTLDEVIRTGFSVAERVGAKLWGINAVANGFFLSDSITVGLRYICGNIYGNYAGDEAILGDRVTAGSSGDDYETTLRSYILNGSVVRLDYLCPITKYFAPGGIDAELKTAGIEDRQIDHKAALEKIAQAYPDLAKTYTKAGGITNLRLKTITHLKIGRP
jgi:hypothetical protein